MPSGYPGRTPWLHQFQTHRGRAKFMNIPFRLTFEQWLGIWKKSKRLPQRGNRKGKYVMARFGDEGAYEIGNVKIILFAQNIREAKIGKPRPDLSEFNKSRRGVPLSKQHRARISAGFRLEN
jgi:hypothetical protein